MEIVESYELKNNRGVERVHQKGVGYDLLSKNKDEERYIEVKGVSETWNSYTWQSLHPNEVRALSKSPGNFFLYIVHFERQGQNRDAIFLNKAAYQLFIINGKDLQNNFRIIPESFALKPISRKKLKNYKIEDKPVVLQPVKNL